MTALQTCVSIWGSCFGVGLALGLAAICIGYPFQVIKQGIEQI